MRFIKRSEKKFRKTHI